MEMRGGKGWEGRRTGFESEGGDVDDDFGARFEDDEEHADWAGDAVELEIVVQLARVRDGARRVWECGDVGDALEHGVPFIARTQVEALDEGGREMPRGHLGICVLLSVLVNGCAICGGMHAPSCPRHWPGGWRLCMSRALFGFRARRVSSQQSQ